MTPRTAPAPGFATAMRAALAAGAAGTLLLGIGALADPVGFFHAWLLAFMFYTGLTLGSLALLMLQHLTGGLWGVAIRRTLEAASATLPLVALFFVPLVFGLGHLYAWSRPEPDGTQALGHLATYLNRPFFLARAAGYFAVWALLSVLLRRWSLAQDEGWDPGRAARLRRLSAAGLILYVLTMTLAATDWLMSLEPHWFSTIFGLLVIGGQGLAALSLATLVAAWLHADERLAGVITRDRFHDLGNLLLTFVMLWTYFSFSQYLIIWSENLPEETLWYAPRARGGWQWLALVLVLFHFAVPFWLLLFRRLKRSLRLLATVAAGLLAMRLLDLFWLMAPSLHHEGVVLHWLTPVAPVALGGWWLAAFLASLSRHPLLPRHDPQLAAWTAGARAGGKAA